MIPVPLLSLEQKKQKLINEDFNERTIQELMREDPFGTINILYQETCSARLDKNKGRTCFKTAFRMLPELKREDLIEETKRLASDLYYRHFSGIKEKVAYYGALVFQSFMLGSIESCLSERLDRKFTRKYLAE